MFTRRHEQELAEIKALALELDQRVREVLEQIERMQAAHGSQQVAHEGIREEIEALATRYGLVDGAADALHGLVRLVDWGQANFVPRSHSNIPERDTRGLRAPPRRFALNMLAESLAGLELEPVRTARRIGDVGSGAGFPGLVLAIALPQARVALIERVPGRCDFLRHAAAELGLDNVEVVEEELKDWREGAGACDLVSSRKVGRLDTMVEWSAPLLAPGGAVALWPGTTDFSEDEPAAAAKAADAAGLRLAQVLPVESENRKGQRVVKRLYLYEQASSVVERAASPRQGADSLVAFVHIPKTAGGTITSLLADAYPEGAIGKTGNYLTDSESTLRKVAKRTPAGWEAWHREVGRLAVGHTPYAVFREGLPAGTRYITFLREPVERVLSHYYRHIKRRNPRHAGSPKDLASGRSRANSLEEALAEMHLADLSNLATRFLCSEPSTPGELSASALDEAKANLRGFAFVGIQERFDESLVLLQRTLGLDLGPPAGRDRHVSIDRPTAADLTDEERALIEEHNQLDAELYAFGLELFEDAVRASDVDLSASQHQQATRLAHPPARVQPIAD